MLSIIIKIWESGDDQREYNHREDRTQIAILRILQNLFSSETVQNSQFQSMEGWSRVG